MRCSKTQFLPQSDTALRLSYKRVSICQPPTADFWAPDSTTGEVAGNCIFQS